MRQAERLAELERRITQLEQVVAQLCDEAEDDDQPNVDLDGNVTPVRDTSAETF